MESPAPNFSPENFPEPERAELFFAFVGRIGVNTRQISQVLSEELSQLNYRSTEIKLTKEIQNIPTYQGIDKKQFEDRYVELIKKCNRFRDETKQMHIMAALAVNKIFNIRSEASGELHNFPRPIESQAYIINQLKRKEEIEYLRKIYKSQLFIISCHASHAHRKDILAKRIAEGHPTKPSKSQWESKAEELIVTDDHEEDVDSGQRVRDAIPEGDFFIDATSEAAIRSDIKRLIRLIFGDNRITPSREEYGMYLASAAALRSSDLSRQVGAAILSDRGEVAALGCNEVPRPAGGAYWEGDEPDHRDFAFGGDENQKRKRSLVLDVVAKLKNSESLSDELNDEDIETLANQLIDSENAPLKDATALDIIEFGRAVHAEMAAITEAAKLGRSIAGLNLYVNTFPCHNCAKHIVSSGLAKVVFLRPYPKSGVFDLYPDSIRVDADDSRQPTPDGEPINFRFFKGVGPNRYAELFQKKKWKDELGKPKEFSASNAAPKISKISAGYLAKEIVANYEFIESIKNQYKDAL